MNLTFKCSPMAKSTFVFKITLEKSLYHHKVQCPWAYEHNIVK